MKIEILIKEIRKEKNMSLNKLSRLSGLSTTNINDIENNKKMPSLWFMVVLSKSLNVDIKQTYKIKN